MKHGTAAASAHAERRGIVAIAALAILALAIALLPASADAAKADGSVEIDVVKSTKAGKKLLKAKVKASKPASTAKNRKRTTLDLPVRNAKANANGKVTAKLKGSIVLQGKKAKKGKKRRAAKLKRLKLISKGKKASLKGKLGKRQLTVFKITKGLKEGAEEGDVVYSLKGAKVKLDRRAAKRLSKRLKLKGKKKLRAGAAGKIAVDFSTKGKTPLDDYPYAEQCPVETAEGNPGFGEAPGAVGAIAATPTFANPKAVSGVSVDWGFKSSFRGYVAGTGSLQTLDGAVAKPQGPSMAIPGSHWEFPVAKGAYERGSALDHSDDRIVSEGTGTVLFCNSGHGFNVVLKNPTVTIDGASSRITADVGVNLNGEWYPFQRADIATLDLSGVTPNAGAQGDVISWEDVPATLTEDGAKATGLYPAGTALDPITVRAKVDHVEPYPYAAKCTGFAPGHVPETPPTDVAGPSPFPVFEAGQAVGGTEVDWGFKESFRGYVAFSPPPGSFSELDGAVAVPSSTPPGMGAPGSFWSFTGDTGTYEPGTEPDHSDDKLVANSAGTVVFCKAGHGFGIVLQSPTVVIDGENSRIVASMGGNYSDTWYQLQRTDVAELDLTGITPTVSGGGTTITWENIPGTFATNGAVASGLDTHGYPPGTELDPITVEVTVDAP